MTNDTNEEVMEFGDLDPEDEWDDTDAFHIRLAILERIIESLSERRDERFRVRLEIAVGLTRRMIQEHREESERLDRIQHFLEQLN